LLKIIITNTQKSSQDLPQPAAIKYTTPHWRQQLWLKTAVIEFTARLKAIGRKQGNNNNVKIKLTIVGRKQ